MRDKLGSRYVNRSCMDNVYTVIELVQGRLREKKHTYFRYTEGI